MVEIRCLCGVFSEHNISMGVSCGTNVVSGLDLVGSVVFEGISTKGVYRLSFGK